MVEAILPESYGYGYIMGLGAAFALLMIGVTYILSTYVGEHQDSEHFSTASRSVKTGLISSAVVSSWTWPGTLLTSSGMAYSYGVCGSTWYAFAFTIQITFFSVIALEVKRKAPGAHTVVEVIKARFGTVAHWVFLFYGLGTNVVISAMLLLGGCQAISVITGMHIVAASMLLPLGVWAYTVTGGLKSTFLSDWIHSVIIYIVILTTVFVAYCGSSKIGSIDKMYDMLTEVAMKHPSAGHEGSYLTFSNKVALFNGWNIVVGGFSTVFCDPSYGQKAIAAKPLSAMKGYFAGGLCWLVIPWALGTAASLSCLALMNHPESPTYPDPVPTTLVNEGIPMLYGMFDLMGKPGAAAGMLMVWLAATSATSAELIGFSSVMTYDVYRTYIKPDATGKQLVRVSHLFVTFFAIAMGALTVVFNYIGITISWIITFIGIALGPAVFAITLALFWRRTTAHGMIWGPIIATFLAIMGWCVSAKTLYGAVNKDTLGDQYSCAVGNFVGMFGSLILIVGISLVKPDPEPYDFSQLNSHFTLGDDATTDEYEKSHFNSAEEEKKLKRASNIAIIVSFAIFFILIFLVPMPMYGQNYIFSKKFFRGWVIVIMIWLILAACFIIFYPIYESREVLVTLYRIVSGKQERKQTVLLSATNTRDQDSVGQIEVEAPLKT